MTDIAPATPAVETPAATAETPTVETPATPAPADETPDLAALQAQLADLTAERDKWKTLSRKHEAAAKAPKTTEEQVEEIRKELAETRRRAVAASKGVPLDVLLGDSEDELNESADRFLAAVAAAVAANKPAPTPVNDTAASGNTGTPVAGSVKQLTRADLQGMKPEEIVAAKAAGQLRDLLGNG